MKARFVLDESSWAGAIEASLVGALADAVERLLERLDAARDRDEPVVKHENYYETDLGDGVQLYAPLFDPHCPVRLDRDLTNRLITALDRANAFDDSQLTQYDAEFHGKVRFAPGVIWAHTSCREGRHVAVFPLPLGEVPVGKVPVAVAGATLEIFFVAGESQHVDFFRSVIALENADEEKFERLARSAFPALDWADNVWRGLGHLSRPYIEVRDKLVRCLGGLSDDGAACFHEFRSSGPTVNWRASCRPRSARKPRMRMALPSSILSQSETVLGAIAASTRCSGGTSNCGQMWTGFTFFTSCHR